MLTRSDLSAIKVRSILRMGRRHHCIAGKVAINDDYPAPPSPSLARAVHRNACDPLPGVPVGLLQPLDQLSDKHTDTLSTAAAGGGLTFHDHSSSAGGVHDHG